MNINHIDLRHLRYFLAVADELSFSRAAKRLNISQPPLSMQIRDLETRMETRLFARTQRHVELTRAGYDLVPRVRQILRDIDHHLHSSHAIARGQIGEIRIATIYSAPLMPQFVTTIRALRRLAPQAKLSFSEMRAAGVIQAVAEGKADIGFNWQVTALTDKRLVAHIIAQNRMGLYLPSDHALAKKMALTLKDLSGQTLFLTSLQSKMGFAVRLRQMAQEENLTLNISEEAAHFSIIANLIAAGCGMGFLPASIAQKAQAPLSKKSLRGLDGSILVMPLALIYRNGDDHPVLNALIHNKKPRA